MEMLKTENMIWLYRKMMEIRTFEEVSLAYFQKPGHGSHHPCIGHEAIEAAMGVVLREKDYLFSTHRSHGHLLTKGLEPKYIMAELWGKTTGYCKGRGGSMHVTDWSKRVMPSGIVGTSVTLATGVALAIKLRGDPDIAMASFGDGAINSGSFHEGMNMAAIWHLPAVFVCENNGLAVSTHLKDSTSVNTIADRAVAYAMPGVTVEGTDPIASYTILCEAVDRARSGGGPTLVVANVRRWKGHAAWDRGSYLTKAELDEMNEQDPLPKYRDRLIYEGVLSNEQINAIDLNMRTIMEEAVRFAEDSPAPSLTKEEALKYVFA